MKKVICEAALVSDCLKAPKAGSAFPQDKPWDMVCLGPEATI